MDKFYFQESSPLNHIWLIFRASAFAPFHNEAITQCFFDYLENYVDLLPENIQDSFETFIAKMKRDYWDNEY